MIVNIFKCDLIWERTRDLSVFHLFFHQTAVPEIGSGEDGNLITEMFEKKLSFLVQLKMKLFLFLLKLWILIIYCSTTTATL
jgi:hypothetical protein